MHLTRSTQGTFRLHTLLLFQYQFGLRGTTVGYVCTVDVPTGINTA